MAAQEPVTQTTNQLAEGLPRWRVVFRKRKLLIVVCVSGFIALATVLKVDFPPKTDEERFRALRKANQQLEFLASWKGQWIDDSYATIMGESLSSRLAGERWKFHTRLASSGFLTDLAIPLTQASSLSASNAQYRVVYAKIKNRITQENLHAIVFHNSATGEAHLSCPKQDVPGWQEFFSTLPTNSPPAAQPSP